MVTVALFVRLEAKPGKESDVENFLNSGLALVREEPETTAWFAIRINHSTFGIFDAFSNEAGREAHPPAKLPAALLGNQRNLLANPPPTKKLTYWQQNFKPVAWLTSTNS